MTERNAPAMSHDPLCPSLHEIPGEDALGCWCYLIGKVRADERERIAASIEALAERIARNGARG